MDDTQGHNHPLAKENLPILKALQAEGQVVFHWGFPIYRCDYSDDALFDRFHAVLRRHANEYAQRNRQDRTTALYLTWTVNQDREALGGATKEQIRTQFTEWRNGLSVERDGLGADHRLTRFLPRFEYCVHVGKGSLDSLRAHEEAVEKGTAERRAPPVLIALIRAPQNSAFKEVVENDEKDDDEENLANEFEPIDGCTAQDLGWVYVKAAQWVTLYKELHEDRGWEHIYRRPPQVANV
ncbi:hypothetical protein N0V93_009811 [Gnomoniopsis smithogilvyi]|uniref:Uncharacterized protein n=1 Tax=Gnomoniopsis smithogilvyi TaxID=1191159 RepID=A0A9W8YII2_9PEZI|nr:hypothetical protein N0V93_009811 [Gnomoniopsis smithogilvyi]